MSLRGQGGSDPLPMGPGFAGTLLETHTGDLAHFLESLPSGGAAGGRRRAPVVVGHSRGALIAQHYMHVSPSPLPHPISRSCKVRASHVP